MVLRRIGALSTGKMAGLIYGSLGIIAGALVAMFSLIGSAIGRELGPFSVLFGVGAIVFLPVIYAFFGFLGGMLVAVIYNAFAGMIGGIEVELS